MRFRFDHFQERFQIDSFQTETHQYIVFKFYTKLCSGEGGGGLRPEVQPLALLYTSFDRRSTPFESHLVNITNDTPLTYTKLSCLFHSYEIHLLGPSADRNDRFPTIFYKSTSETPTLSYTGILKKVPLWALKKKTKQKTVHF